MIKFNIHSLFIHNPGPFKNVQCHLIVRILYHNVIKSDSTIIICNPGNSTRERRDANPRPGGVDGIVAQTSGPRSQLVVSHLDPPPASSLPLEGLDDYLEGKVKESKSKLYL